MVIMVEQIDFNWRRDVGKIDPCQVESLARASGESLEDFARDFLKRWPLAGEPSEEQVQRMVSEMTRGKQKA
jgi:hypothetical protein